MRSIINISLPEELNLMVEKTIETGKFATKSEFFRHLLRLWMEGTFVDELDKSRKELQLGKGKILKSLKQLR
jgi:Arc/MetJ-type ribon-helix-helix transcriptional regulator